MFFFLSVHLGLIAGRDLLRINQGKTWVHWDAINLFYETSFFLKTMSGNKKGRRICNIHVDIKTMSNHSTTLFYPHLLSEAIYESSLKTIKTFYKYLMSSDLLLLLLLFIIISYSTWSPADYAFFIQKKTYFCTSFELRGKESSV